MCSPGIGPTISSAIVAAIGTGDSFAKGRDFAAWLGLVSMWTSIGDRTKSRQDIEAWQSLPAPLFVQAAWEQRSQVQRRPRVPSHINGVA
jgi:transposase